MQIVAADIGGTNARFAIAEVSAGKVVYLGEAVTFKTADYTSFETAWQAFAAGLDEQVPRAAGIAIAAPVHNEVIKLTNSPWVIRPATLTTQLHLDRLTLVNDFGAVGHAVAHAEEASFSHICGPDVPLPEVGVISVVGPGTGLGVAHILRRDGRYFVNETEGGHIDFAPLDTIEDAILIRLRQRYRRVSTERLVSGPGLANIYEALAAIESKAAKLGDDKTLWADAIEGSDPLAAAALDRFCMSLGSVAGDIALAQGAGAVVIAGGVGSRIAGILPRSGFSERFVAKGRFERMMAALPVKLITHPEPGLYGAAAAFAEEHAR
jgi:glucokinase